MYALMALISAGVEAGAEAVARSVGNARRRRALDRAEPLADSGGAAPRGVSGSALREISGRAVEGPVGAVTAPLSGRSCVWYAVTVRERYEAWRPGPLGPIRVVRHSVAAWRTSGPLYVTGDTVSVRVDTYRAQLDVGEAVFSAFEDSPNGPLYARLAEIFGTPPRPRHRDRTLGFAVEERIVAAGDPLRVVGPVRTELGDLVLGKSGLLPLIVTRAAADGTGDQ